MHRVTRTVQGPHDSCFEHLLSTFYVYSVSSGGQWEFSKRERRETVGGGRAGVKKE